MLEKVDESPQNIFLVLGLIFGLLFIAINPPFQVPDEPSHFYKAYHLSEGNVYPEKEDVLGGYNFPKSLPLTVNQFSKLPFNFGNKITGGHIVEQLKQPLDPDRCAPMTIANVAFYPPLSYLAPAIAFVVLKFFKAPPIILLYLGRLANLLVWVLLVYLAIRIIPVHKWVLLVLALMPMTIYQAASLSADSLNIALSFLIIALFFNYSFNQEKRHIELKDIPIILVLITLLALAKQGYAVLLLLFFMIPPSKFKGSKNRITSFSILAVPALAIVGIWNVLFKDLLLPFTRTGVSTSAQVAYLIAHPLHFPHVVFNTLYPNLTLFCSMFVGNFGWRDTPLPDWMVYSYLVVLLVVILSDKTKIKVKIRDKIISTFTFSLIFLMIFFFIYITWEPVGADAMGGLQSRYFIPIMPLLLLLLYNRKEKVKIGKYELNIKFNKNYKIFLISFIVIFLLLSLRVILLRYYIF